MFKTLLATKRHKREQAARIACRIIPNWEEAQLAIIETGLVDLKQVFLPYAQTMRPFALRTYAVRLFPTSSPDTTKGRSTRNRGHASRI
jgi:hypothetical protein